jgi:phosphatidylinositol alpha-mannosyltransferase
VRIALLHPYSWPAVRRGGERYLHDLARWLGERGHEVTIVTGATDEDVADEPGLVRLPLWQPARLTPHGVTPLDTFGGTVIKHLLRHRYDVVHSLVPSAGLAAAWSLQPSVYTVLGHPSPTNPPPRPWSRALMSRAISQVRVPAALSRSAADGVEALYGRRPLVLPPGVRTREFAVKDTAPSGPPVLLFNAYAGDPRKRLALLLAAMPRVLEQLPDARLQLGGGGDASEALDGLDPGVRRVVEPVTDDLGPGSLADVPERYRRATVSVLPSVDEAFGLVLVESLSCGTPIVCARSGGMPEIVTGDVGRVAEPEDSEALSAAIVSAVSLAADVESPARCAAHAQQWDWGVLGPQHELAYARARS